jgi:hypothetical protein
MDISKLVGGQLVGFDDADPVGRQKRGALHDHR